MVQKSGVSVSASLSAVVNVTLDVLQSVCGSQCKVQHHITSLYSVCRSANILRCDITLCTTVC